MEKENEIKDLKHLIESLKEENHSIKLNLSIRDRQTIIDKVNSLESRIQFLNESLISKNILAKQVGPLKKHIIDLEKKNDKLKINISQLKDKIIQLKNISRDNFVGRV